MNLVDGAARPRPPGSPEGGPLGAAWLVGPAIAYALYLFVTGSLPDVAPPMGANDKLVHFVAFALMVPLSVRALRARLLDSTLVVRIWTAVAVSSALGALLELWQSLLPF